MSFSGPADQALQKLVDCLSEFPRTKLLERGPNYVHVTFRTPVLRFVDDGEFLIDADQKLLHVRSASRFGYSDLGANRQRIEQLRQRLTAYGFHDLPSNQGAATGVETIGESPPST